MSARKQRCNAAYRNTRNQLRYCKTPAGKGTDHDGEGPCQVHDLMCEAVAAYDRTNTVPSAFEDRREYTMNLQGPLGEKIEALGGKTVYFNPSGRVADLSFEIVAAKALAMQLIEDYTDTQDALLVWAKAYKAGTIQTEPPGRMYQMADLERMLTSSARIVALSKACSDLVPLQTVAGVLKAMSVILEKTITDPEELVSINQQCNELFSVFRPPERVQNVRPVHQRAAGRQKGISGQLSQGRLG